MVERCSAVQSDTSVFHLAVLAKPSMADLFIFFWVTLIFPDQLIDTYHASSLS